jgi:poly-gamma-glutamate capsule biosynthesis protein CapA/YwtB (metallophosphatase superfamily)
MKFTLGLMCAALLAGPCAAAEPAGVPDGFTVALGGDMIGPFHPLPGPEDAGFARVADLFRKADLGFANQEGSILDLTTFTGYPAAENGGAYLQQDPPMAKAMRGLGLTIVSKANNHATDWGTEGLVATLRHLKAAGLAQAGAGMSEAAARAPGYVETRKGLAALVDTASTFTPMSSAGPAIVRHGQATQPRPGISALHLREVRLVPAAEIGRLRVLAADDYSPPGEARIGDLVLRAWEHDGWTWEIDPGDAAAVIASVRQARAKARFVLFSIHAHETAGHDDKRTPAGAFEPMVTHRANEAPSAFEARPAEFEPILFHAAIDAGADAVARTGPHWIQGIEIYKGRPIFYGLGGLFFDRDGRKGHEIAGGVVPFPDEQFESLVPVVTYKGGKASLIRLYPIDMTDERPVSAGAPHLADAARALRILQRAQALSAPFGTTIAIEDGVGVIRIR